MTHPYLKPRSRDYKANREVAAAEALPSLFLKPLPRAWTIVYERVDMPKHFTPFGLF